MAVELVNSSISITVGPTAEPVELLPQRAVYWPAAKTLLTADLHWGKCQTFRSHGIPIPGGILDADLDRLTGLVRQTGASRVVFLGDLIHGRFGMTSAVKAKVADWRKSDIPDVELVLVRGNHDRHCKRFPDDWRIDVRSEVMLEGPFALAHHPEAVEGHYTWAGHIHPAITLSGRADTLRLPCFHVGEQVGVLPAYGSFTGGFGISREKGDRIFAVVEQALIEV